MKFTNLFKKFHADESGAVTVDWVVLTAAIVGLGLVVMTTVGTSIRSAGNEISNRVDAAVALDPNSPATPPAPGEGG